MVNGEKRIIDMTLNDLKPFVLFLVREAMSEGGTGPVPLLMNGEKFLDLAGACSFIHLSKPSVYRLVGARKIPFYKSGRKLLFKPSELTKWVEGNRKKFTSKLFNNKNQ